MTEPSYSGGVRVVLVEDNPQLAGSLRDGLAEDGFAVEVHDTAAKGIARGMRRDLDLMILDLVMPSDCDGYKVLEQLRTMPAREETPVIVISDQEEEIDTVRSSELGALDYLSKPFGYDQMDKSIKRVLEATPEQIIELRETRLAQVETYKKVIDLVDEAKESPRRGLFRRARAGRR